MQLKQTIREGRQRLGLSRERFAMLLGVSRAAVQQWESPDGPAPNRNNRIRLAACLDLSMLELVAGRAAVRGAGVLCRVPIVTGAVAAMGTAVDNHHPSVYLETVQVPVAVLRHTFAWRVEDRSMTAPSGDCFAAGVVVVVEPDLGAQPGDFVITRRAPDAVAFRQLVTDSGTLYLNALNRNYPVEPLGEVQIIGVVRALLQRFR